MPQSHKPKTPWRLLLVIAACTVPAAIGCQVDISGQTVPSGYYLQDDVQYFPPGPEFKLAKEAAAMKTYKEEQAVEARMEQAGTIRR